MTRNDPSLRQDAWLADFTDQMLNDDIEDLPASVSDPEARALAETLLRLKHAFPEQEMDPALMKRMRERVLKKWQEEERKKFRWPRIFRLDWLTPSRRRQFGMAFAVIVVAGILIVTAPYLFSSGDPIAASAGSGLPSLLAWIALGVLIAFIGWLLRRKP